MSVEVVLYSIAQKLRAINKKTYIIGSFCVHKILKIEHTGDIDLTTDATPTEIRSCLKVVGEIGEKYGTLIIKEEGFCFEITTFRQDIGSLDQRHPTKVKFTDSLKEDASRRDFTINAIYYDILKDKLIDPFNGIVDLQEKKLRFVGSIEARLNEDVLRILRFVRFKNKYQLQLAQKDYELILKNRVKELKNMAIERVKQELDKMLLLSEKNQNVQCLEDLQKIGFLAEFLPWLEILIETIGWPSYHLEGNVWIHTKLVLMELNKVFVNKKGWPLLVLNLKTEEKLILLWAIVLHDIGKAKTLSCEPNGKVHYYGHDIQGVKIFKKQLAKQFRFSKKEQQVIIYLIKNHCRLFSILEMKKVKAVRFMMESYFEKLLILWWCDSLGKIPANKEHITEIINFYLAFKEKIAKVKLLTGYDVLKQWPDLKGRAIAEKIEEENNKLLKKL